MLRVLHERLNRRLSQVAVAALAPIHQPTLSQIERGRIVPTRDELRRLARVYGVSPPSELLKDVAVLESAR